ncbi:hypothetical protein [Treponema putidum]|uniref:hypothetical protein n=1 Tax=Treponema putidum TaxID=221027 RepID=UPI003D9005D2
MNIKTRVNEVEALIIKYKEILKNNPSNFSAQLTLSSLERHKEELLIKLEENYSHLIFLTNIDQDDTICTSIGTVPSENFIGVDFSDYSASYHGDNKCKITKTKVA